MCERSIVPSNSGERDERCRQGGLPCLLPSCLYAVEFYSTCTCLLCNNKWAYLLCCATLLALWWFFLVLGREINRNPRQSLKMLPLWLYWSGCRALQGRYYQQMNGDAGLVGGGYGGEQGGRGSSDSGSGEVEGLHHKATALVTCGRGGMR